MDIILKETTQAGQTLSVLKSPEGDIIVEHDTGTVVNQINLSKMEVRRPEKVDPIFFRKGKDLHVDLGPQTPANYNPLSLAWAKLEGNPPQRPQREIRLEKTKRIRPPKLQMSLSDHVQKELGKGPNHDEIVASIHLLLQALHPHPDEKPPFIHLVEHDGPAIQEVHTFSNNEKGEKEILAKAKSLLQDHFESIKEDGEEPEDDLQTAQSEAVETFEQESCWKSPTLCLTRI